MDEPRPGSSGKGALPKVVVVVAVLVVLGGLALLVCGGASAVVTGFLGLGAVEVNQAMDQGQVESTRLRIHQVEQGLELYAVTNKGRYPSTAEGLEAAHQYLPDSRVPTDAWGRELAYYSPSRDGEHAYEIVSLGKDGQLGGAGSDADIHSWDGL